MEKFDFKFFFWSFFNSHAVEVRYCLRCRYGFLTKSISKPNGRATAMPTAWELKSINILFTKIWNIECTMVTLISGSYLNVSYLKLEIVTPALWNSQVKKICFNTYQQNKCVYWMYIKVLCFSWINLKLFMRFFGTNASRNWSTSINAWRKWSLK